MSLYIEKSIEVKCTYVEVSKDGGGDVIVKLDDVNLDFIKHINPEKIIANYDNQLSLLNEIDEDVLKEFLEGK